MSHANNKSKRRFLPNLQVVSMLSDALGSSVRLRLTAYAIRSIEINGGIDAYLLKTSNTKLPEGARRLKRRIERAAQRKAAAAA